MHEMTIHMTMYYTPTAKTVELKKKKELRVKMQPSG